MNNLLADVIGNVIICGQKYYFFRYIAECYGRNDRSRKRTPLLKVDNSFAEKLPPCFREER